VEQRAAITSTARQPILVATRVPVIRPDAIPVGADTRPPP
jgi:hypothetical protein